jgi:hypothetical protein
MVASEAGSGKEQNRLVRNHLGWNHLGWNHLGWNHLGWNHSGWKHLGTNTLCLRSTLGCKTTLAPPSQSCCQSGILLASRSRSSNASSLEPPAFNKRMTVPAANLLRRRQPLKMMETALSCYLAKRRQYIHAQRRASLQ